ncbi:MAG TPA: ferritin-like domain-containing protein [Streptosporangiaceae bacterium]|nr:ferritin-like domain-containing protein [Streptosporangiaceae bacterium]
MALLPHYLVATESLAYRLFGVTRDKSVWRAQDILRAGEHTADPARAEIAWRSASRGYYAEQAGLVAAAKLAADTDDPVFRLGLALAAADEARHADAFYQYARAAGGELEDCHELIQPLDDALTGLPHLGRALVHTMLEGFAADDFHLLSMEFADDAIGALYGVIRRDEVQHVAIGLSYLARVSATRAGRELWAAHGAQWHATGLEFTYLDAVARSHARQLGRDPAAVRQWFWRRHRARLSAAGIAPTTAGIGKTEGGEQPDDDRRGQDQGIGAGHLQVHPPD